MTSTISGDNVVLEWKCPLFKLGVSIDAYYLSVKTADGVLHPLTQFCNISMSSTISRKCVIPLMFLRVPPFNLNYGDEIKL